jgi:hypothetical protein
MNLSGVLEASDMLGLGGGVDGDDLIFDVAEKK